MKPFYTITAALLTVFFTGSAEAQIYPGHSVISTDAFSFEPGDSLHHPLMIIDTGGMSPWQIGTTLKPYFSTPDTPDHAIMTLLSGTYPVNTNKSFLLKLKPLSMNPIFSFVHKYETDSGKDGGIVEFSLDTGVTWQNMLGDCHRNFPNLAPGVLTQAFYKKTDTLYNGEPGFSGNSNGWKKSWFQFFSAIPVKGMAVCNFHGEIQVRFRFLSDSVAENMDGWLIDSLTLRIDHYSSVKEYKYATLDVYPNPSMNGVFHFPQLTSGQQYRIAIRNILGQTIIEMPYKTLVDLGGYRNGLYFYHISNGEQTYTGKLLFE